MRSVGNRSPSTADRPCSRTWSSSWRRIAYSRFFSEESGDKSSTVAWSCIDTPRQPLQQRVMKFPRDALALRKTGCSNRIVIGPELVVDSSEDVWGNEAKTTQSPRPTEFCRSRNAPSM